MLLNQSTLMLLSLALAANPLYQIGTPDSSIWDLYHPLAAAKDFYDGCRGIAWTQKLDRPLLLRTQTLPVPTNMADPAAFIWFPPPLTVSGTLPYGSPVMSCEYGCSNHRGDPDMYFHPTADVGPGQTAQDYASSLMGCPSRCNIPRDYDSGPYWAVPRDYDNYVGPQGVPNADYDNYVGPQGVPSADYDNYVGPQGVPSRDYDNYVGPQGVPSRDYDNYVGPQDVPSRDYVNYVGPQGVPSRDYDNYVGPQGVPSGDYDYALCVLRPDYDYVLHAP
ncbi:hypothetical protein C8F04DRAFT_1407161 [Mycena alexandri]|uniref:Uncharacterized protein n=1 Tax=Mycena alexandri TaxID=1745969 RepID=A0AAD6RW24_9AGAR|nr:hypothetical protein C8F04DRAFT_1407161 [Mycena alexandri]